MHFHRALHGHAAKKYIHAMGGLDGPLAEFGNELALQKVGRCAKKCATSPAQRLGTAQNKKLGAKRRSWNCTASASSNTHEAATFGRKSHVRSYVRDTIMSHSKAITWEPS